MVQKSAPVRQQTAIEEYYLFMYLQLVEEGEPKSSILMKVQLTHCYLIQILNNL